MKMSKKQPSIPPIKDNEEIKFYIGEYLKSARKDSGYSQTEVAEILGIAERTVVSHETGEHCPNPAQLIRYISLYMMPHGQLVREIVESPGTCQREIHVSMTGDDPDALDALTKDLTAYLYHEDIRYGTRSLVIEDIHKGGEINET